MRPWVNILHLMRIRDPGWKKFGSRMEIIRIRDGKNLDPGFGINIPDPQHWFLFRYRTMWATRGPWCPASWPPSGWPPAPLTAPPTIPASIPSSCTAVTTSTPFSATSRLSPSGKIAGLAMRGQQPVAEWIVGWPPLGWRLLEGAPTSQLLSSLAIP